MVPPKKESCPSPALQAVSSDVIASNPLGQVAALAAWGLANLRGGTAIVRVGGNVSANVLPGEPLGGSVGASLGIAVDRTGNIGVAGSWQFGGGFRASQSVGYSAGGTITSTRQPTIFSFSGSTSPSVGISAGVSGFGGSISGSPTSGSVSVRAGLAGGLATFGGVSATKVLPLVCR